MFGYGRHIYCKALDPGVDVLDWPTLCHFNPLEDDNKQDSDSH